MSWFILPAMATVRASLGQSPEPDCLPGWQVPRPLGLLPLLFLAFSKELVQSGASLGGDLTHCSTVRMSKQPLSKGNAPRVPSLCWGNVHLQLLLLNITEGILFSPPISNSMKSWERNPLTFFLPNPWLSKAQWKAPLWFIHASADLCNWTNSCQFHILALPCYGRADYCFADLPYCVNGYIITVYTLGQANGPLKANKGSNNPDKVAQRHWGCPLVITLLLYGTWASGRDGLLQVCLLILLANHSFITVMSLTIFLCLCILGTKCIFWPASLW